jgi:hypothetical protein
LDSPTLTLDLPSASVPMTVTLNSSSPSRNIFVSTNGGADFVSVRPDVTLAPLLVAAILSPVTHVRVTGAAGDRLHIVL